MAGLRDTEYIDNRLIAPPQGLEAVARMRECGMKEEAAELMTALQAYTEVCRKLRAMVVSQRRYP